MKKQHRLIAKPQNTAARALADPRFRKRVVCDKKKYSRKGKLPRDKGLLIRVGQLPLHDKQPPMT